MTDQRESETNDGPIRPNVQLFQIKEDDLAELERVLPQICDAVSMQPHATTKQRMQIRLVQRILLDVRWNYGPSSETEIVK